MMGLWQRAREVAPTAIVVGVLIGVLYWNLIGEDRPPTPAVATGGLISPGRNHAEFQDHTAIAAREEKLRALRKIREADLAFVESIEEQMKQADRSRQAAEAERQAAAQEAKRQADAKAEAERQAAALEAKRQADAKAEAVRQAAALEAKRQADAKAEAERQAAALEAKRQADAKAEAERQAATLEAKRQADAKAEAAEELVPPSPSAPAPVVQQAIRPTAVEPDGAPGLLIRARSGETLQTLYLRVYRGLTPPPFASVAAINPERIRPGDILTFPTPVNGWAERNDADAVFNIR
jgi:hypothetical protein